MPIYRLMARLRGIERKAPLAINLSLIMVKTFRGGGKDAPNIKFNDYCQTRKPSRFRQFGASFSLSTPILMKG